MDSVADRLRAEDRRVLAAMTAAERVRLALRLGERDLETFRLSHAPPLDREHASRLLRRQRQAGRRPSRSMAEVEARLPERPPEAGRLWARIAGAEGGR